MSSSTSSSRPSLSSTSLAFSCPCVCARLPCDVLVRACVLTYLLSYVTNDREQSLELLVDRMQIDNCLYNTPYPIMLYPVLPPNMKVLQMALVHSREWKTITFIRYARD